MLTKAQLIAVISLGLIITGLFAEEPFELKLEFTKTGWGSGPNAPDMKWAKGFLMVDGNWTSSFTDKDNVKYEAWIESASTDWGSANTVKTRVGSKDVWRQKLFISPLRDGARKKARLKMTFGYRPPGQAGALKEAGGGGYETLPAAHPLSSGDYTFTFVVRRSVDGGPVEEARKDFDLVINDIDDSVFISGLETNQVFQRTSKKAGELRFDLGRSSASRDSVEVTVQKGDFPVLTKKFPVSKADEQIILAGVPMGGPYTVGVACGGSGLEFQNIYVGDLWIISGESNAVGTGRNDSMAKAEMSGVHGLNPRYGILEWQPARDGFFDLTVGPWVTAAQEFYQKTGVPVGLIGHAAGGKPIDYFLDETHQEMPHLKPMIERHGHKAAILFWYQGESDASSPESSGSYGSRLSAVVAAARRDTGNPDLKIGVVQLAKSPSSQDDSFSPIREAQRQFVDADPHAALYATLPYEVNAKDRIHLETAGCIQLGEQIGRHLAQVEQGGEFHSPGPNLRETRFADSGRKEIVLTFSDADGLQGGESVEQWHVTDSGRRGLDDGGVVPIASVQIDAQAGKVMLKLAEPAGDEASVSYGYRSDLGRTLRNGNEAPAPAFVKMKVADPS